MELTLMEFLHGLLESSYATLWRPDHQSFVTEIPLGVSKKTTQVFSNGRRRVFILSYLAHLDAFEMKSLRRLRGAVAAERREEPFNGELYPLEGVVWWKLSTLIPRDSEAAEEVLEALFNEAHEDFIRLDLICSLSLEGKSIRCIREAVSLFGMVEGRA